MKFKSGEIIGNITRHLPGGKVEVDYAGTLLTLPATDNELLDYKSGGAVPLKTGQSISGTFYRVDTGFIQDRNTTAADVLNYEADELENDDAVDARVRLKELGIDLSKFSHKQIMWVTKTKGAAARYGSRSDVQEEPIENGTVIVPDDGDGGMLILKAVVNFKAGGTLLAPNGQPTNLTEAQWHQVRTQEFKAWFGDWENDPENASKVVDENGEPLVVYHGSKAKFDEFDETSAIFFTPKKDMAKNYGNNIYTAFLDIKNPITEREFNRDYKGYDDLKYNSGYDGIFEPNDLVIYVFNNDQINLLPVVELSLSDNSNNPDIRFESGGELGKKEETYQKWKSLVNMSKGELDKFYNSQEGKDAGISTDTAKELGISRGRTSAKWIMKMKETPVKEWTPEMWEWANKQISFISRMKGNKGGLYDDKGEKTRKHTSLLIWGHNPEKYAAGGSLKRLAPNGKRSSLPEKLYNTVRTQEFKAWFGDWENDPKNSSQVVDHNGEPLVMYHGGGFNSIGEFKGTGWFTSVKYDAKHYSKTSGGDNVTIAFLNVRKPFYSGRQGKEFFETNTAVNIAIKKGNDGVIDMMDNKTILDTVVFNSNQIKLTSNSTFDTNNKDVRLETGGQIDFSKLEDIDWDTFYNTPVDYVPYVNPETAISKEKIDKLNNLIDEKTVATENELAVWFNKNYKKNTNVVYSGGDDIHGTAMSIGGINEARKFKNIRRLQQELLILQKAKQILSSYNLEREGELHENLLSDYRRQDYIKPNGKKMSSDEQFQIDEGYNIIFNLLKTSFKRGGQVSNGPDLFSDLNSQLGFDISEFLDTPIPAPEPIKVKSADVESIPLSSIYTDEARFQNRDKLNQELVDHIAENWSDADQDPIHVWKDPKQKNKIFVLSGHHRYYGAKKANRKTVKIIDRSNEFDEQQAIKFAKEEANANRTMETALERAKALRAKRLRGDSREEINQFLEREGKNKNYVNNLSYLSPNGKTLKTLEQFGNAEDKQLQKETEQRSDWIGEARRTILGITDAHENELFDFLFDKSASKRVSTKAEFLQKVRSVVNPMQPDEPLNIARFKLQTQGEAAYDQMVADKKAAITERQDKINKLNDRFNNPYAPDFISTESPGYDNMRKLADSKISQLDVERKMLQKQLEDIYRDKMKYTAATTSGSLFLNFKTGGEIPGIQEKVNEAEKAFIAEDERLATLPETEESGNPFSICTNGARWVKNNFFPNAKVVGYSMDKNPTAEIGAEIFGHDFLLLNDRYIIDFWYKWINWNQDAPTLLDLQNDNDLVKRYYGDTEKWEELDNFKTGGELLPEINDLLGFSIDEFVDTDTLNTEFTPEAQPLSNPLQPPVKKTDKSTLQDYGEKIGGAKKDLIYHLENITSSDLQTQPLSKAFPQPNYKQLYEDGIINQDGAILLRYMYENIPTKPRRWYMISRWADNVSSVVETFRNIMGGTPVENIQFTEKMQEKLRSLDKYKNAIGITTDFELYYQTMVGLSFPMFDAKLGNYRIRHFTNGWRKDEFGNNKPLGERYSICDNKYIIKDFDTLQAAIVGLKSMLLLNKGKAKAEGTVFNVYKDTKTLEFFIGKKGSIGVIRLIEGFKTGKEAFEFLKENQLKLQGIWDGMKEVPDERNENNRPRIGVDWRKGEDITSEKIATTFNFRGVEFGNWVNSRERQNSVNEAYDALMDLASITGISPAALGLSGQLAFAFGARGSGKANAHYEPDKVVINLTKTRGSGSLAHEWWHALDNYFSRMRGMKHGHVTEIPRSQYINNTGVLDTRVREEVFSAYKGVVQAIEKSGLPARSKILDGSKSKLYWSTIVEMSARAFENFVINKLNQTDQLNDYLANFKEMGQWIRDTNGNIDAEKNYPYPLEVESEAIDLAYQQFFDVLQVKKDEVTGKDVLFEKGGEVEKTYQQLFQERVISAQILSKELGGRLKINSDGSVTIYHGTSIDNQEKILSSKQINAGTFFSKNKSGTGFGDSPIDVAKRKFGDKGVVMEIKAYATTLESAAGGSEIYTPDNLYLNQYGIWDIKKEFESGGEIENDIPDTMNTGYAARIQTNMQYIGSKLEDWRPVPIKGFVLTEGSKGKMVEMPEFEFPKGYDKSKTLYVSSQDSPCCELCGKSPIAKFFYIQNDNEKTIMITGSECVTHFGEGKSGKENLRATKINLAIMMDHDLGILAKYIKDNYSYMHHIGYGRQERNWKSEYVGQSDSDNNKKYDQIKNDDISILLDPKNLERVKITFKDEPKYIEQANYIIDWQYILSKFPSFGWRNQLDLIKRNYDSQETGEKKLLTWYKKNEHAGRMLLEKVEKILKVLGKFDENVLYSQYLSAVNISDPSEKTPEMARGGNLVRHNRHTGYKGMDRMFKKNAGEVIGNAHIHPEQSEAEKKIYWLYLQSKPNEALVVDKFYLSKPDGSMQPVDKWSPEVKWVSAYVSTGDGVDDFKIDTWTVSDFTVIKDSRLNVLSSKNKKEENIFL